MPRGIAANEKPRGGVVADALNDSDYAEFIWCLDEVSIIHTLAGPLAKTLANPNLPHLLENATTAFPIFSLCGGSIS